MSRYLIHISIGPVQSFIAQARKTQDLFAGSALITKLRLVAMKSLIDRYEAAVEFITPFVVNNQHFLLNYDSMQRAPKQHLNKLECIVDCSKENLITGIALVESEVKKYWISHVERVCTDWNIDFTIFEDQVCDFIEITAIATEFDGKTYIEVYNRQQATIEAGKAMRAFRQSLISNETGKKCHVDHTYNIRIYRPAHGMINADEAKSKLFLSKPAAVITDERTVKVWHLAYGEGLSAISAAKRMVLNEPHTYPSTAQVAIGNALNALPIESPALQSIKALLSSLNHSNDELLFKENINADYFTKHSIFSEEDIEAKLREFRAAINGLYLEFKQRALSPTKYYAVFKFDGDNSNKRLSGHGLRPGVELKDFHKAYSKAQFDFVEQLSSDIVYPLGKVVFAGEDFLIFINLEHLGNTLSLVANAYADKVANSLSPYLEHPQETPFTYSGGLTIAHYKEPLQFVLDSTRDMEKRAKRAGRNMLGLKVLNSSGGSASFVLPWTTGVNGSLVAHMDRTLTYLNNNYLSSNFLRVLSMRYRFYRNNIPNYLIESIFKRGVARSYNDGEAHPAKQTVVDEMVSVLDYVNYNQEKLLSFFYIMDFIHRKTHEQIN